MSGFGIKSPLRSPPRLLRLVGEEVVVGIVRILIISPPLHLHRLSSQALAAEGFGCPYGVCIVLGMEVGVVLIFVTVPCLHGVYHILSADAHVLCLTAAARHGTVTARTGGIRVGVDRQLGQDIDTVEEAQVERVVKYSGWDFTPIPDRTFNFKGDTKLEASAQMRDEMFWEAMHYGLYFCLAYTGIYTPITT